jgi:hypothetical protein
MSHVKILKSTPTCFDHAAAYMLPHYHITTYEDSNFNYVILTRNK